MKRLRLATLIALSMTAGIHRLPAPVVEEPSSPTPAATQKPRMTPARSKPERSPRVVEPVVRFAGTWRGTASGRINEALFGQRGFSSDYSIEIAPDEKTVTWTSSAWISATFHAAAQKNGRLLSWTTERHDIAGRTNIICRLEQTGERVARYSESSGLVNGAFKGAGYELTGTLTRQ